MYEIRLSLFVISSWIQCNNSNIKFIPKIFTMSLPPPPACDWQTTKKQIKERGQHLLETGMWSDCRFIVGTEPNQQVLEGHKLFLAMSSPVFEAMFYGGMAEKDPIAILDVQPDAFRALLEYVMA